MEQLYAFCVLVELITVHSLLVCDCALRLIVICAVESLRSLAPFSSVALK